MSVSGVGKRRNSPTATIHDVAQIANVSLITVSRAFNSPELLSPNTLKKVMDAAATTGYVPNLVAGGLRSSRTRLVAALVPTLGSPFAEMVQALTGAFALKGYQVVLGQIGSSFSQENEMLRAIIGRRPDGIVITGVTHSPEARKLLAGSGIPIVETWDTTPAPIDMLVSLSHEQISHDVCKYLVGRGRRRLALISGDDPRSMRRNEAFLKTAQGLGLQSPAVHLLPTPTNHAGGRIALGALLARHPDIDAVFCSSDMLAMGVITEAQVRGIAIPHSLAVVGAGDMDFAATLNPSLTTVRMDAALLGKTAAQFIIDRAEGREIANTVVNMEFSLIQRQSA
jgi:LacI family gluconate utilization system Gnt-I transcriptional repressor